MECLLKSTISAIGQERKIESNSNVVRCLSALNATIFEDTTPSLASLNMTKKWLYISLIAALLSITSLIGIDCNAFGVADLRGNEAAIIGISIALFIAASFLTMIYQYIKCYSTSPYFYRGAFFMCCGAYVYASTILHFSKSYCH